MLHGFIFTFARALGSQVGLYIKLVSFTA